MISLLTAIISSAYGMANRGASGIASRRNLSPSAKWTRKYLSREGALHLKANAPMEKSSGAQKTPSIMPGRIGRRSKSKRSEFWGAWNRGLWGKRGERGRVSVRVFTKLWRRGVFSRSPAQAPVACSPFESVDTGRLIVWTGGMSTLANWQRTRVGPSVVSRKYVNKVY